MQTIATSTGMASLPYPIVVSDSVAAVVMRLLTDADKALDADWVAAKSCIAQASALLQAERDRGDTALRGSEESNRSGLAPWQFSKVKAYVEDNLDTPIRTVTLAKISRLSASYFSVAFKRSVGETLHAYLSRRRVERAQQLMLTTDHGLSQIALDCGFCDQAHLSRVFRRLTGLAPNQWRRQRLAQPI
jgi:AraC family transcriptional regulator